MTAGTAGAQRTLLSQTRLDSLSPAKRALLEKRLAQRGARPDDSIVAVPRTTEIPLSSAQRRLWFMDQLSPGSAMFNLSVALRLTGSLSLDVLAQSVRELFGRHEALRTVFASCGDSPVQRILPDVEVDLTPVPLPAESPDAAADAALEAALHLEASRPFSLEHGPLARAKVFRCGPADHVFVLSLHHSVCDGWSMSILIDELLTLYAAGANPVEAGLEPLPLHYADFAAWEARPGQAAAVAEDVEHWRRTLRGAPPVIDLPLDRPRPAAQSFDGGCHRFALSSGVWQAVQEIAREEQATPFTVLLAGFSALLSRYSVQGEVSVATPVANRPRVELENMIGFFTNSIVLRLDTSGDPTFRELVGRARDVTRDGIARSTVPFERVVEAVDPPRSLGHAPLAQVSFAMVDDPALDVELGDLRVTTVDHHTGSSKYDLTLELWPRADGGLHGTLEYAADLFDEVTAARIASHLGALLDELTSAPQTRIGSARLAGERDEQELRDTVLDRNRTADPPPGGLCAHEMFEAQVHRTPDAPALVHGERALTFAELDRRAERLAARLRLDGVGPQTRVGLFLGHDVELVVAVLATLKAGGAFVPLDLGDPAARTAFVLADADVSVVVTTERHADALPAGRAPVVLADDDGGPEPPAAPRGQSPHPEDLCYLEYTSGPTGPMGVAVTHRGLANYLAWSVDAYRVADGGRAPLLSPPRLDRSMTTLFGPLAAGHPVTIVEDGDELAWRARTPGPRLVTEYGPAEAGVGCCAHEIDVDTDPSGTVPIGRPIANVTLHVLDASMTPVPRGVVGELHVGGAGVARGYWNRPGLTTQRFLPDPFTTTPGARLYRTGDLVRLRSDGELEHLGRLDDQVRVRGYRVEPAEIEAALTGIAAVRQAAVVLREGSAGDGELVAYVTAADAGSPCSEADLRAALGRELPPYLLPASVVTVDALPLTPSGQVDRLALRRQVADDQGTANAGSATAAAYTAPVTALEKCIADVWSEVLGVSSVGREANFLELGGHSLLATRAVARLRDALSIDLPLRVFLRATSLADLAARIEDLGGRAPRPVIVRASRTEPAPLSYAQGRLYFLNRLAEDSSFYNVPIAFRLDGELHQEAFRDAFAALWARHEGLRTRFPSTDGEPVQDILPADEVPFELVDLDGVADPAHVLPALVDEEARRPFDLAGGPLLRCKLVRLGSDAHAVLMTLHHAVSDGWSVSIVLDELMVLYRAFATGAAAPLPPLAPLPFGYVDYTHWQRSWLDGPELTTQLGYWKQQLADVSTLELPTDRPRPAVQSFRGARHEFGWPRELSRSIGELGRREGVSLFMVLLAGFDVLMAHSSGQSEVTVGTPIANRTLTEVERVVGFFANTLALRVDLSGDPTFSGVLSRVREVAHDAYANQDVPFEMVVDAVAPARSLSHSPLFQVRFALQNQPDDLPDPGPGLAITEIENEQHTARFDLVVDMWETEAGLEGQVEYSTDLFDADTVARLMARYEALFERLLRDPGQRVAGLDITAPGEPERLAALGRGAQLPPGTDAATFVHRFEERAARHPDAPAVTSGAVTVSYGQLDRRAEHLARVLAARGVGPEVIVAVYLERGIELVTAVLAVLKAGGAYLPLDPAYPAERLSPIVADARPALVLTARDLAASAPAGAAELLAMEDAEAEAPTTAAAPTPRLGPDHAAYVVYTSGTKGLPKGVVVTHGSLAAYLAALPAALELPAEPAFLHTASFSFSSSVRQLAVPLALGGRVVIAGRDHLTSPETLLDYACEHGVDVLDLVPSYLRVVQPAMSDRGGGRPRLVLTASEPLLYDLPEAIRGAPGEAPRLVNMYGQTETTGIVVTAPVATAREGRGAVVPLGRPIPGTQVHIVDDGLRPVPLGHPGEIVIGGTGLARGYLGDPALTAERFVASPFGPAGSRVYRTGDRGRFLSSGKVEFLGRIGDQVKIRGHRVEPAEVASVLSTLEGVGECAVLCVEDGADERRLVGYVAPPTEAVAPVVASAALSLVAGLRAALKARLPDYMVPALALVDGLPRLPNGKVDRAALLATTVSTGEADHSAPRNAIEDALAAIWQEVLHLPTVGTHDNFFEVGGDSLHSIRVVDRARRAGITITPMQFIANPTIAELAAEAAKSAAAAGRRTDPTPDSGPATSSVPLVPSHLAFLERDFADKAVYTHPFIFETLEKLDPTVVERAVSCVVAHHDSLRITFPDDGGRYRVRVQQRFDRTPFTNVDLSALDPAEQDIAFQRLDDRLHRRLDFADGPLVHIALVQLGPNRPDRLIVIVHHQLMDNSSWDVLMEDFQTCYAALAAGLRPQPPQPTASFAAWARNLDALAHSPALAEDIAYWTALAERPVPSWPVDHEGGDDCMSSEESVLIELDAGDTASLRRMMAREYQLSLNDALLAATLRGFTEWSGQSSMIVDLVARGRELGGDLDLSRAIGRFSMTSPRLIDMPAAEGPRALLDSVAEQLRAVPRRGLGFGLLRYIGPDRSVAAALAPLGKPHILLNNWGEFDNVVEEDPLLGPPIEDAWPMPKISRMHRLMIDCRVYGGALRLGFRFSTNVNDRASIERLTGLVQDTLGSFVSIDGAGPGHRDSRTDGRPHG